MPSNASCETATPLQAKCMLPPAGGGGGGSGDAGSATRAPTPEHGGAGPASTESEAPSERAPWPRRRFASVGVSDSSGWRPARSACTAAASSSSGSASGWLGRGDGGGGADAGEGSRSSIRRASAEAADGAERALLAPTADRRSAIKEAAPAQTRDDDDDAERGGLALAPASSPASTSWSALAPQRHAASAIAQRSARTGAQRRPGAAERARRTACAATSSSAAARDISLRQRQRRRKHAAAGCGVGGYL